MESTFEGQTQSRSHKVGAHTSALIKELTDVDNSVNDTSSLRAIVSCPLCPLPINCYDTLVGAVSALAGKYDHVRVVQRSDYEGLRSLTFGTRSGSQDKQVEIRDSISQHLLRCFVTNSDPSHITCHDLAIIALWFSHRDDCKLVAAVEEDVTLLRSLKCYDSAIEKLLIILSGRLGDSDLLPLAVVCLSFLVEGYKKKDGILTEGNMTQLTRLCLSRSVYPSALASGGSVVIADNGKLHPVYESLVCRLGLRRLLSIGVVRNAAPIRQELSSFMRKWWSRLKSAAESADSGFDMPSDVSVDSISVLKLALDVITDVMHVPDMAQAVFNFEDGLYSEISALRHYVTSPDPRTAFIASQLYLLLLNVYTDTSSSRPSIADSVLAANDYRAVHVMKTTILGYFERISVVIGTARSNNTPDLKYLLSVYQPVISNMLSILQSFAHLSTPPELGTFSDNLSFSEICQRLFLQLFVTMYMEVEELRLKRSPTPEVVADIWKLKVSLVEGIFIAAAMPTSGSDGADHGPLTTREQFAMLVVTLDDAIRKKDTLSITIASRSDLVDKSRSVLLGNDSSLQRGSSESKSPSSSTQGTRSAGNNIRLLGSDRGRDQFMDRSSTSVDTSFHHHHPYSQSYIQPGDEMDMTMDDNNTNNDTNIYPKPNSKSASLSESPRGGQLHSNTLPNHYEGPFSSMGFSVASAVGLGSDTNALLAISALEHEQQRLQDELQSWKDRYAARAQQEEASDLEINDLKMALASERGTLSECRNEIAELRSLLRSKAAEASELQINLSEVTELTASQEIALQEAYSSLSALAKRELRYKLEVSSLQTNCAALQSQADSAHADLRTAVERQSGMAVSFQRQQEQLRVGASKLKEQDSLLEELRTENRRIQASHATLDAHGTILGEKIRSQGETIRAFEQASLEKDAQLDRSQRKIAELADSVEHLNRCNEDLAAELDRKIAAEVHLQHQITQLTDANDALRKEVEKHKDIITYINQLSSGQVRDNAK